AGVGSSDLTGRPLASGAFETGGVSEPFLGCRRGSTITHLCRGRGNVVARLRAVLPPFKSRNAARFKGAQTRGGGRCGRTATACDPPVAPAGVFRPWFFFLSFSVCALS